MADTNNRYIKEKAGIERVLSSLKLIPSNVNYGKNTTVWMFSNPNIDIILSPYRGATFNEGVVNYGGLGVTIEHNRDSLKYYFAVQEFCRNFGQEELFNLKRRLIQR